MSGLLLNPSRCCCSGGCHVSFNVKGNASLQLGGAVATIWTSSAKTTLLGTATTDCSGLASIDVPPGPIYWEVDHPSGRLTKTIGATSCGGTGRTINTTLSTITAGYYGLNWSPLPVPGTLHYSDSFNGPVTLTHSGANWVGSTTTSFGGGTDGSGNPCSATSQTVTITLVGAGGSGTINVAYNRQATPSCGSCAGGSTARLCTVGLSHNCASGTYTFGSVSWFGRYINPVSSTAYTGTLTE